MMNLRLPPLVAIVALFSVLGFAGESKVIANSSVKADTVTEGELRKVFLEEDNSLKDGTHVEPVLEKDGAVHEAFLREYMGRTNDDLQTYYRTLVFTGKGSMPKKLGSDAEVVAYVAKTRGAIGYVSAGTSTEGLKTLTIVGNDSSVQRRLVTRVEPKYPETLKRLSIGGIVRLQVTIGARVMWRTLNCLGEIRSLVSLR